jgi:hypothetical protein
VSGTRNPLGLTEELGLEQAAVLEHEQRAAALWRSRFYAPALEQLAAADAARARVRELEAEAEEGRS